MLLAISLTMNSPNSAEFIDTNFYLVSHCAEFSEKATKYKNTGENENTYRLNNRELLEFYKET